MTANTQPTPLRIAIIEDDVDLLEITLQYMRIAGFSAWGVGNGDAFYKKLAIDPVDVVMIDVGLPGEDGFSISRHLRSIPDLSVIIVSSHDTLDDRLTGLETGADRYMVKPVNLDELIANIRAMAHHKGVDTAVPAIKPLEAAMFWHLSSQFWTLTSPAGKVLSLTVREYRLLEILIAAEGRNISKQEIANDIIGKRMVNASERLDVLLARLRKKANDTLHEALPIITLHMHGYAFTAPAKIQ